VPGLDVHLVTPEREVWAGDADFVIARSVEGDLGILPGHTPTLAALEVGAVYIAAGGQRMAFAVDGGFLHVGELGEGTRVDILAEHAAPREELRGEDLAVWERRAEELRGEGRFAEARAEDAKAATRRRLESE
jgi:F-type H+-transporting ATPase subunit epsilon